MFGSFRVGSILGITIRVHFLLLAVFAYLLVTMPTTPKAAIYAVTLFGIVMLHELGHSVVAQSFGIRVVDITLWPLGGMARMAEIPESTKIEALVAIAGPAVNFVLAGVAGVAWLWSGSLDASHPLLEEALAAFFGINLLMGVFNLIPAFPMDGGRILRAILGRSGNWLGATETAVRIGRVFAIGMGVIGIIGLPPLWIGPQFALLLLAVWLWWAGGAELWAVRVRHTQNPFDGLRNFMRERADWSSHGVPGGVPHAPPSPSGADATGNGFRPEDIERLERFRGRLSQYPRE